MKKDRPESDSEQQISIANGIFFQNGYSVRPDYRQAMQSAYRATMQRLDFANKPDLSTKYINRFVRINFIRIGIENCTVISYF